MGNNLRRALLRARHPSLRRVVGGAAVAVVVILLASGSNPADAAPGTWGANGSTYLNGTVCTDGTSSSPLASWAFGDTPPEYLLTAVSSDGVTDSDNLPMLGTPGRLVAPLTPGHFGFATAQAISDYAALLSTDTTAADAAAVARAVLAKSDPAQAPNCVTTKTAAPLITKTDSLAGPYVITLTSSANPDLITTAEKLSVLVTNTAGTPVPGVTVAITSSAPVFAGSAVSIAAVTDATGTAIVPFTAPDDPTLAKISFAATASVSVGLESVTVPPPVGSPAGTPSGYANAVFAAPPTVYTGKLTLPIVLTAKPVLTATVPASAVEAGTAVKYGATLTGMFGHSGQAAFTVAGPVALDPTALCAKLTTASFTKTTPVASNAMIDVHADAPIAAGTWTPTAPGCYQITASVVTSDATPKATAKAAPITVTVLDTTATVTPTHTVYGPGLTTASVVLTHSYGVAGTITDTVQGPMTPGDGNCTTLNWSKSPLLSASETQATDTHGDGTYPVNVATLIQPGCYKVTTTLTLPVGPTATITIPVAQAAGSDITYVLAPTVSTQEDVTSVVSPATAGTHVTVLNTYDQPGHLSTQMYRVPADEFGCRTVDFTNMSGASPIATGKPVAFTSDGTIAVQSGITPKLGCYALVTKLVMDNNTSVTAVDVPSQDDIILAGLSDIPAKLAIAPAGASSNDTMRTELAFGIAFLLIFGAALGVIIWAFKSRDNKPDPTPATTPTGVLPTFPFPDYRRGVTSP